MNFIKNTNLHSWSSFLMLLLATFYTQSVCSQDLGDFLQTEETSELVFSGIVVDQDSSPAMAAVVMIFDGDVIVAGANADENGFYKITISSDTFETSNVSLKAFYLSSEKTITNIPLSAMEGGQCTINIKLPPEVSIFIGYSNYPDMAVRKMWSGTHITFNRGREVSRY